MDKISIGIVDDDALIVNLLKNFLDGQEEMDVRLTASNGKDCLQKLRDLEDIPEILLMDLKMDEMNGIETTQVLKKEFPNIKTIIISSHYKVSFMGFMLKTGVSAFAPKGISTKDLLLMIKEVKQRGYYFNPDQLEIIREQLSSKFPKPVLEVENILSEREIDVLKLLCQQKTAKEIGEKLFITKRTVEGHKNNLFVKTGAKNVAGLVIYAVQNGIINADSLPII
ncbi:MAG: DNA-binding NarL/FixJ family response regulator [Crocinitomix sp.]|jgi:DNA-binding NarL/FixJ family response regulator